jgi:hypothetical protein
MDVDHILASFFKKDNKKCLICNSYQVKQSVAQRKDNLT